MNNLLIDTDIILDFFFDRKPFSEDATQILSLIEAKKINGFLTPVICSNVYYLLRQTATHQKVIQKLGQILTILEILSMDKEVILKSLNSAFQDFEDALQHFTTLQSGLVDVIVTRNIKDYKKSEIGVMTPEDFLSSYRSSHSLENP